MPRSDPAKTATRETVSARILREMTDAILSGQIASGARLEEALIASHFGASRTPVREALRELAALGLVETEPHRGATVMRIDDHMLLDRFETMAELEAAAGRLAAQRMTAQASAALLRDVEDAAIWVRLDDKLAFRAHNIRFHEAIYAATGNAVLIQTIQNVRRLVAVFRARQFDIDARIARSHEEHLAIAAALVAGDATLVSDLLREHLLIVRAAAAEHLRRNRLTQI